MRTQPYPGTPVGLEVTAESVPAPHLKSRGRDAVGTGLSRVIPKDGLQFVLFVLVVFSISRVHQHYGFLGAIRPGVTLLALGALFALINPQSLDFAGFSTRPAKFVASIVLLACISVPFGLSPGNSARFLLEGYFRMLAVYLLLLMALMVYQHSEI